MRSALETPDLDRLDVVRAGPNCYTMAPKVRALPAAQLVAEIRPLRGRHVNDR